MNNASNIKIIWRGIRKLITLKPMGSSVPSKILLNQTELTDSKNIANAFKDFFTNMGKNLSLIIPEVVKSLLPYLPNRQTNSFCLDEISFEEISNEINQLNPSKSFSPFSIPTKIFITLRNLVSKPLHVIRGIFNLSFLSGEVPHNLKGLKFVLIITDPFLYCECLIRSWKKLNIKAL